MTSPDRPVPELMGIAEIADLIGRTRQRAWQITTTPGFPEPVQTLTMGKVWRATDVRDWVLTNPRRPLVGDRPGAHEDVSRTDDH